MVFKKQMNDDIPERIELENLFWKSINSLVTENKAHNFPHHIASHCLLISKDNKVVLNKRLGVENQQGRISASFEEQMQFPFVFQKSDDRELRYYDGDLSPFHTIIRGAKEELNIDLALSDIRILALCMESTSVAANFISIAKSQLKIEDIYNCWINADDKNENRMIPINSLPYWGIDEMSNIIQSDEYISEDGISNGVWHASSKIRILLGLFADFGFDEVSKKITIPEPLTNFCRRPG